MIARPKIKLIVDVPCVIQLETTQGRESKSDYTGIEYAYNVIHDSTPSILYLPAEGRHAIEGLRPEVGDFVELLKQKRGKEYFFHAQIVSDGAEPAPPPPPQRAPVRMLAPAQRTATTNASPSNGYSNGHGRTATAAAPQFQAMPPHPEADISPVAQQLAGCLRVSLDAWEQTRLYAQERYGVALTYTSEDVRAVGLSFYIGRTRDGGK